MRKLQRIWQYFQQHRVASIVAGHLVIVTLGLLLLGNTLGAHIFGAFAHSPCSSADRSYVVVGGDTLGGIAGHYKASWQHLASYNHIAHPNVIHVNQTICIPGRGVGATGGGLPPARGSSNYFPYGQCTWWADERYHTLHGIYVPWKTNANAWQWAARARDFHWHVSSTPAVGDIMVLQPWVQGAYGLGHVAVVERVLGNGHVIASNMNWGAYYWQVTDAEFSPGSGVTFIHY